MTAFIISLTYLTLYNLNYLNNINMVAGGTLFGLVLGARFTPEKLAKPSFISIIFLLIGLFLLRASLLSILPPGLVTLFIIGIFLGLYLICAPYLVNHKA